MPALKVAEQEEPQLMPAGELVTDPMPVVPTDNTYCDWGTAAAKLAVTFWLELRVTLQLEVPEQAPFQPAKDEPEAGIASKLTTVPALNVEAQVEPQLIPAGTLEIVPVPLPAALVVRVTEGRNEAVMPVSAFKATVHVPVPAQAAALQPPNADPEAGVAVSVTTVPELKTEEQLAPQLMPTGLLVTVPEPAPDVLIESVDCIAGEAAKVAVTELSAFRVTLHPPEPAQAPPQPVNAKFCDGTTVSVTTVPEIKFALQDVPQLMPAGVLTTVPLLAGDTWMPRAWGSGAGPFAFLLALPEAAELPEAIRVTPPLPQPFKIIASITTTAAPSFSDCPVTWLTNSSCPNTSPGMSLRPGINGEMLLPRPEEGAILR